MGLSFMKNHYAASDIHISLITIAPALHLWIKIHPTLAPSSPSAESMSLPKSAVCIIVTSASLSHFRLQTL